MNDQPSFGYIDPNQRAYVITDPNTPEPGINYLMGENLNLFISNGAGGPAWYGQPNTGRLTRYRFNGLPMDTPGFYLYVKDKDSVWNPSHFPTRTPLDRYECRHSLGTTRFTSEKDGMQDILAAILLFPEEARTRVRLLLRSMTAEGWTLYNFAPDSGRHQERPLWIDAIVWGVFTLHKYLSETGDSALFDEVLPYFDKGEGTVLDHLLRGMKFVGDHTGSHGLPLLFDTDWNDMLVVFSDAREGGETVMVAEQYVRAARQMIELLRHLKQEQEIPYFEEKIEAFTKALSTGSRWRIRTEKAAAGFPCRSTENPSSRTGFRMPRPARPWRFTPWWNSFKT